MVNRDTKSSTMTSLGVPLSRGVVSTSSGRTREESFTCNRCQKPLVTTVFVCGCDCVFCEGCTYDHFKKSSQCPTCGKTLSQNDFMELVVAEASSPTAGSLKQTFQGLFTKTGKSTRSLTHPEACMRVLKSLDHNRRAVQFLLKQFLRANGSQGQHAGSLKRAYDELKVEYTEFKQQSSSERLKLQQSNTDLQNRVQALNGTVQDLQNKLAERDTQVQQFRQLYADQGMARIPTSAQSIASLRRGSTGRSPMPSPMQQQRPPPIHAFVMQKHAHERAQQAELEKAKYSQVFSARRRPVSSTDSVITPIHMPQSAVPSSISSVSGGGLGVTHPPPGSSRIRNLTSSAPYIFPSRSRSAPSDSKRRRTIGQPLQYGYHH